MKKNIIALFALVSAMRAFPFDYVVEGQINKEDGSVVKMIDYNGNLEIDSAKVENEKFRFMGSYDSPAYVRIQPDRNSYANCVLDNHVVVDFETHLPISGGPLTQRLMEFMNQVQAEEDENESFQMNLKKQNVSREEFFRLMRERYDSVRPILMELYGKTISDNPNGVGVAAVYELTRNNLSPDEWYGFYDKMSPYIKNHKTTKRHNLEYTAKRNSQPGMPFLDFDGLTPDGNIVKLSDYVGKGKYVLVDYWASWCGPCKEEAENTLRPLYEKYKNDDRFLILGVATWDKPENTMKALEKLKYPWPQIIGTGEHPMTLYGMDGIPQIMLFGPDGKIIDRDLRGDNLILTVESNLKR